MKTLVTGAAGFIGSHIVDRLITQGHEVITIDNESARSNSQFYWNKKAQNYKFDICDVDSIFPLFNGVDTVFHLAAEARIQNSIEDPLATVKTNAIGTMSVLHCSQAHGVKKVINSSTSSSYGRSKIPNIETNRSDCLTPYSASKVCAETLCKIYWELHGIQTFSLRYFNVYGPRQPLKGHYAPVIGLFFEQLKANKPLTVVGDGEQRRDFTHIDDVVDANIKIFEAQSIPEWSIGSVFNVGTGKNYSINEIVNLISANKIHVPPRKGESRETLASNSKMFEVFKWLPRRALEEWISEELERTTF
jgi:UDP-glucose 4-epimerase